jgi:hypothetical protein
MPRYCTKYVEIEAIRWDGSVFSADEIEKWSGGATACRLDTSSLQASLYVATLEGEMRANPGDYIICGLRGEYYPCKPDVFDMKYQLIAKDDNGPEGERVPVDGEVPPT